MKDEKDLGAQSATAVEAAGSIASAAAPHVAHTPGPWFAKQQTNRAGESLGWIVTYNNGRIGWSSYATAVPNEGEGAPHTQGGANAHLIAAAPELLALAKFVVEHPRAAYGMGDVPHAERCEMQSLALAAIAKAEGR